MTCRSCGHEIAPNAIVCYKCGTPTEVPASVVKPRPTVSRRPQWVAVPIMLGLIALAVWGIPQSEPGSAVRWVAWAALVLAAGGTGVWLRRR